MSQPAVHPLAEIVHKEEKNFLMQHYARLLIEQVQADEQLRGNIIESLLIARSYVDPELASRIADLLQTHGHQEELKDFPLEEEEHSLSEEGESEAIGLFEDEEDDEGAADEEEEEEEEDEEEEDDEGAADEEEDLENLFAVDSESFEEQRDTTDYVDDEDRNGNNPASLFDGENDEDHGEALFAVNEDEFEVEEDSSLFAEEDEDLENRSTSENLFEDEGEEVTNQDIGKEGQEDEVGEEDQDAGVLFNEDIYSENKGETKRKSREQKDTPGFTPTESREQKDTPGFEAPDIEEKESKIGKRKKEEERGEKDKKEKGKADVQEKAATEETTKTKKVESEKDLRAKHAESTAKGEREALERMTKAKEELERRKKKNKSELQVKEKDKDSEAEEINTADLLAKITYQVSLDDLEKKLGIQVVPEDRMKLDLQLAKKMREPAILALIEGAEEEGVTLAILPRLPRCILKGQFFKVTGANMVRSYPQFFEHVQQVVLKLRTESFFLQESPELDWAIFSCEVLPDSRNKNYMQQKQVLKQHAQRYQSNELRVRRRNLIDTLYDLIVIKLVHDQSLLSETVDLTESKIGRQNLAFINFGENGIRISDITRQQTHAQLGVCPSW